MKVKFYQAFAFPVFTLFLALQLLFNSLNAQQRIPRFTEEEKNWSEYDLTGWQFGINLGMYLANKNSAAFYNGLPDNENNIAYILKNYYWYNEIKQELNGRDILKFPNTQKPEWTGAGNQWASEYNLKPGDTAWWVYYPLNLKYDAAISPGFYAKYNFNNTTGIFVQSNYVKLKTSGIFQLVIDSITGFSEPALRHGFIRGEEERISIDVGISKHYRTGRATSFFIETGFSLNSTEVLSHKIMIGNREYSIVNVYLNQNWVPNSNVTAYKVYQGGLGYGLFLNGGFKFIFSETISIDPGIQLYFKNINLKPYNEFATNYYFYVRMIFSFFGEI